MMKRKDLNTKYEDRFNLARIHFLRMQYLHGKSWALEKAFTNGRWPLTEADWRQTPHGASWDSNIMMANWHWQLAEQLLDDGILTNKEIW